jgi:ureidoglycolate lyase
MNRKRTQSFRISPAMMPSDDEISTGSRPKSSRSSLSSTDVVDFSGGRRISELKIKLGMEVSEIDVSFSDDAGAEPPVDHFVEIVVATRENTKNVGWFITDGEDAIEDKVEIPFYSNVTEGGNFDDADWKDQAVVRSAKISWRDDSEIAWMERHLEMTQGFILIGKNPGLMILGEPTHDREDLSENERHFPDISRMKGYLVPAGCGIIIKKGTWHDFPVSVGPDITVFIINTAEVVEALMSMKEPAPSKFIAFY